MKTVTPEAIFSERKWENGYRSNNKVEKGMARATKDANDGEKKSTDGESRFLRTTLCRSIPLSERAVQLKLTRKVHGKRRSTKYLEGLYDVLAPGSIIIEVIPTILTIKGSGKAFITVRNSDNAKFGTQPERQTSLKAYADRRGPRTSKTLAEWKAQNHTKGIYLKKRWSTSDVIRAAEFQNLNLKSHAQCEVAFAKSLRLSSQGPKRNIERQFARQMNYSLAQYPDFSTSSSPPPRLRHTQKRDHPTAIDKAKIIMFSKICHLIS